jgi:hypothetical protein
MSLEKIADLAAESQPDTKSLKDELTLYFFQHQTPGVVAKAASGVLADKLTSEGPTNPEKTAAAVDNVSSFLKDLGEQMHHIYSINLPESPNIPNGLFTEQLDKLTATAAAHHLEKLSLDEIGEKVEVPPYIPPRGISERLDHLLHLDRDNKLEQAHNEAKDKEYALPTGRGEAVDLAFNYKRAADKLVDENLTRFDALTTLSGVDLSAPGQKQNRAEVNEAVDEIVDKIVEKKNRALLGLPESSEKVPTLAAKVAEKASDKTFDMAILGNQNEVSEAASQRF